MKKYKIIYYVADSVFPSQAANSVHVAFQIDAFAKYYTRAVLSVLSYTSGYSAAEVKANYGLEGNAEIVLNYFLQSRLAIYRKSILDYVRVRKIDNVIVYGRSLIGMYMMAFSGKPICFEVHTTIWDKNKRNRLFFKKILTATKLAKLVVISEKLKDIVLEEFGSEYATKIEVIHDSAPEIDARLLAPCITKCTDIGYVGSFYKGRGIELILEMADELPDKQFHLVGGSLGDLRLTESLPSNVHLYGSLPYTEARDIRLKMDVLLAPYQVGLGTKGGRDTSAYMSPLKVFEYMASKKPIIISDLPVIREVLDSSCAILAEPKSTSSWVDAIHKLQDTTYANSLAENAYQRFLNHYTWDKRAETISKCIQDAV